MITGSAAHFRARYVHAEPVHLRHAQIEDDAIRQARIDGFQKRRTGTECLHTQADGTHQAHECFTDGFFVVNDGDEQTSFGHSGVRVAQHRESALLDLRLAYTLG